MYAMPGRWVVTARLATAVSTGAAAYEKHIAISFFKGQWYSDYCQACESTTFIQVAALP